MGKWRSERSQPRSRCFNKRRSNLQCSQPSPLHTKSIITFTTQLRSSNSGSEEGNGDSCPNTFICLRTAKLVPSAAHEHAQMSSHGSQEIKVNRHKSCAHVTV